MKRKRYQDAVRYSDPGEAAKLQGHARDLREQLRAIEPHVRKLRALADAIDKPKRRRAKAKAARKARRRNR